MATDSGICCDAGVWSTATCISNWTATLAWNVAGHAFKQLTDVSRNGTCTFCKFVPPLPPSLLSLLNALKAAGEVASSTTADSGQQSSAVGGIIEYSKQALEYMVKFVPDSWRSAVHEVTENERVKFLTAYPAHKQQLASNMDVLATAIWLLFAYAVVYRGIKWAVSGPLRWRRSQEVLFFPDKTGSHIAKVCKEISKSRRRLWLAMYIVTDDMLSSEVLRAHARGVDVRVIVDDENSEALGSDVQRLADAGVPVLLDDSPARMHHKFAVLDGIVLSGSFNWTRQASMSNCENLVFMRDSGMVQAFTKEFQQLWRNYRRRGRKVNKGATGTRRRRDGTPQPVGNKGGS